MSSSQVRWAAFLIIISTIILSVLLAIVIPLERYWNEDSTDFGQKYPELATLISTRAVEAVANLPTTTPLPINVDVSLATATATLQPNCTRSAFFWVYHPELWPDRIDLGNALFTKAEALQIIHSTSVDASHLVFIQFVAAYLNVVYGADPLAIADEIMQTSEWLYAHPPGGVLREADAQEAMSMAKILEEYNSGFTGPIRCLDDISTYTGQMVGTPILALSVTPETIMLTNVVSPTPKATITPSPTLILIRATFRPPTATATPKPDKPSKPKPTSPPATEAPPPTHEPPPPTNPPPPPPPPTEPPPPPTEPPP